MTKITVVAAVLSGSGLTLYSPSGEKSEVPLSHPKLRNIIDAINPSLNLNLPVDIDLDEYKDDIKTNFDTVEEKSGGIVRFFKASVKKLKALIGEEQKAPEFQNGTWGTLPVVTANTQAKLEEVLTAIETKAVTEIPEPSAEAPPEETLVAVVGNTIIPTAENLTPMVHAVATGDIPSDHFNNFMQKIVEVANKRKHSAEDLLAFMKKSDMPITAEGKIVAFKNLKALAKDGLPYVDIHSRSVPQGVGSYVYMNEEDVDSDRRSDCSHGLHIASTSYLNTFTGDVCVMVLIDPADVIAVPQYNTNKMRVRAYHIVYELAEEEKQGLYKNKAFARSDVLTNVIKGNHIGVTHEILVGKNGGATVAQKKGVDQNQNKVLETPVEPTAKPLNMQPDVRETPNLNDLVKEVKQAVVLTKKQIVADMILKVKDAQDSEQRQKFLAELLAYKKASKVSWERLGVSAADVLEIDKWTSK